MRTSPIFFDSDFVQPEQIPRHFTVFFESQNSEFPKKVRVLIDGIQMGDVIDDNTLENDGYRFHDVFHYTFAAMLGWSPCMRALTKRKRKSNPLIDKYEDGARATITEEAISLLVFNQAKRMTFFESEIQVDSDILRQIKDMTATFEVKNRSEKEWQEAILQGYSLFRNLVKHEGGFIHYDMIKRSAIFEKK